MGKCVNHPDREARLKCTKNEVYLCDECAQCQGPEIHCKFRTSCPIWFTRKENESWGGEQAAKVDGGMNE